MSSTGTLVPRIFSHSRIIVSGFSLSAKNASDCELRLVPLTAKPSRHRNITAFLGRTCLAGDDHGSYSTRAAVACCIDDRASSTARLDDLFVENTAFMTSSESGVVVAGSGESMSTSPTTAMPEAINWRATSNAITPPMDHPVTLVRKRADQSQIAVDVPPTTHSEQPDSLLLMRPA